MTPEAAQAAGAVLVSKDELFEHADILTIHLVLSGRTRQSGGRAGACANEVDGSHWINTSRGPIVDEQALIKRIEE